MDRDRLVGFGLLIGSLAVIIVYAYLVFFTGWWELVIKLTGLMAVAGFSACLLGGLCACNYSAAQAY